MKIYLEKQFNVNVYFDKYQPSQFLFREEIKPIIKKNILHSYQGIKKFFKLRKWKKKYIKSFPSKKFAPSDYDKNLLSIYGSDEVWNFDNPFFLVLIHFFLEDLTKILKQVMQQVLEIFRYQT